MKATTDTFEKFALPYLTAVYQAAFGMCGHQQNAEDLVQKTFLKAWQSFHTFKEGTNCRAWLFRILRNTWIDELRRKDKQEKILPVEELSQIESADSQDFAGPTPAAFLENFTDEQVIKALKELPEQQRLTLVLSDVEQFTQQEIADIMDVPVGTIKSRMARSRNSLKAKLYGHARDLGILGRNS